MSNDEADIAKAEAKDFTPKDEYERCLLFLVWLNKQYVMRDARAGESSRAADKISPSSLCGLARFMSVRQAKGL